MEEENMIMSELDCVNCDGTYKGLECDCCKKKSKEAQELLAKISSIIGRSDTEDINETVSELKNLSSELAPVGGIDDIVAISEAFLNAPLENLKVEQLQLEDLDKRIDPSTGKQSNNGQGLKVSSLCDVPSLDITKILDFSKLGIDLSAMKKIQFSISVPTIVAEKVMNFGIVSVGIKFHIHKKGFSWFPTIGVLESRDEALANLEKQKAKGFKFSQPVIPVDSGTGSPNTVSLEEAKFLISKQYSDSQEISDIINNSADAGDFFNKLASLGVQLTKEIDPLDIVNKFIEKEEQLKAVTTENQLTDDNTPCGIKIPTTELIPKPFMEEDLQKIEKDCCSEPSVVEPLPDTIEAQSIEDILNNLSNPLTSQDEQNAIDDVLDFMTSTAECSKKIDNAAKEKNNASNNWYFFTEILALNTISHKYLEKRILTIDTLVSNISSLVQSRHALIQRNIFLSNQRKNLVLQYRQQLIDTGYIEYPYGQDEPTVQFLYGNVKIYSTTYQKLLENQGFSTSLNTIIQEFNKNEQEIVSLSDRIENLKNSNGLPTLSSSQISELKNYGLDSLLNQIKDNKEVFSALSNPVTNQVGFGGVALPVLIPSNQPVPPVPPPPPPPSPDPRPLAVKAYESTSPPPPPVAPLLVPVGGYVVSHDIDKLHLFVDPRVYQEAKALFAITSVPTEETMEYIVTADKREKLFGTVWNRFYSSNRIDNLFSYQEQGYTSPKPMYDDEGNPLGPETDIELVDPLGNRSTQTVSQSLVNFSVNPDVAIEFWSGATSGDVPGSGMDIEQKTKNRMITLLAGVKSSSTYQNYLTSILAAAEMEAKLVYAANLIFEENSYTTKTYSEYTSAYSYTSQGVNSSLTSNLNTSNIANVYRSKHFLAFDAIDKFQIAVQDKISQLEIFIEQKRAEIAEGEQCVIKQATRMQEKSEELNRKSSPNNPSTKSAPPKKTCKDLLGYDPFGKKAPVGCPDFTKNCYWQEYTKIMQLVSLMPVPDFEKLTKRLFRYYPVGLQIPVISPTGVLPTLASGIPDTMISIPAPLIWKHIVTLSTPVGVFVVWVALAGVIPCPYIMFIDENMEASFLVTLKGPIGIPANSLRISEMDDKPLIDLIKPLDELFNVDMSKAPWKYLYGNNKIKFSKNPDGANEFIDKLQTKIKSAIDGLQDMDWSLAAALGDNGPQGPQSAFYKNKERLRKAFRYIPPDTEIIEEALMKVSEALDKMVDDMKISPIKIPKDPKKLITPVIGPAEFMDDINKLKDQGLALAELGATLKILSLREELKKMIDRELSEPEVKLQFDEINLEIAELEQSMKMEGLQDNLADTRKKITRRTQKIKKTIKVPLKKVADKISPEMLAFIATLSTPIPLPVPCYEANSITPIPPYILAIIAAIKQLPDTIDSIPDDALANLIQIDLTMELPRIEDMIWFIIDAFLQFVPDLKYPDPESCKMLYQAVKSAVQNIFKTKIRLPHPGTLQITITESMIKSVIKTAINTAFAAVVTLIMNEIIKAAENEDAQKILAVAIVIKAILGTDLSDVGGNEIKALLVSILDAVSSALDELKTLIQSFENLKEKFESIKDKLFPTVPPKPPIPKPEGPFMQLLTAEEIAAFADPVFELLGTVPLPFPIILLGCSNKVSRLVLTKMHPFMSKELLPPWEKMSVKNVPYMIWLDQLIATAQKQGGFGSDYVTPYWMADA